MNRSARAADSPRQRAGAALFFASGRVGANRGERTLAAELKVVFRKRSETSGVESRRRGLRMRSFQDCHAPLFSASLRLVRNLCSKNASNRTSSSSTGEKRERAGAATRILHGPDPYAVK
jgi:hypothetical protein